MFQNLDNNKDDYLQDFRQKLANQSMDSFEEKRDELKRSKSIFIGAVSGVAMAAVVGWLVLYPRYEQGGNTEVLVVKRPIEEVKTLPVDPGGMEISNQDKSIYDIIEKRDVVVTDENVLPPPEEPVPPIVVDPIQVVETQTIEVAPAPIVNNPAPVAEEPLKPIEIKVATTEKPRTPAEAILESQHPSKPAFVIVEANQKATPQNDYVEEEEDDDAPAVAPKTQASKSGIASGKWVLQLMASTNKSAVEKSWADLSKKYKVLSGQSYDIERADLGAKGIYYRLLAGGFNDRNGADELCKDVKALGGTCIVKKK